MSWIKATLAELFSLFVDDVWFTISILIWIAFVILEVPDLPITADWRAPLLFAGCAAILIISVWRTAARANKTRL